MNYSTNGVLERLAQEVRRTYAAPTKAQLVDALRNAGLARTDEAVLTLRQEIARQNDVRRVTPKPAPEPGLEERLRARITQALLDRAESALLWIANAEWEVVIDDTVGTEHTRVPAGRYSSRCQYEKYINHVVLHVKRSWLRKVYATGLHRHALWAIILDAEKIGETTVAGQPATEYRVTVVDVRRHTVVAREQFLVDSPRALAIANTLAQARLKAELRCLSIDEIATRYGHVKVQRSDALATGACGYGVATWLKTYGLEDRRSLPVSDVLSLEASQRARDAVCHAIMRNAHRLAA